MFLRQDRQKEVVLEKLSHCRAGTNGLCKKNPQGGG